MFWGLLPILSPGQREKTILEFITIVLVFASTALIIIRSFEEYSNDAVVINLNMALVIYFTIEYALRWMAVRPHWKVQRPYTQKQWWYAKLKYTVSFMAAVDLLSILPFYIEAMCKAGGVELNSAGDALVILRVMRVMRIFKITRHNQTLADFVNALKIIGTDLLVFVSLLMTFVVMAATAIHFAEKNGPAYQEDGEFANIPDSMYWAIITFTSVGYGDIVPSEKQQRRLRHLILSCFLPCAPRCIRT